MCQQEGARLHHGRPYRLNGEAYASAFLHYKLTDELLEVYKQSETLDKDEL